ncbi:MAG: hypothetical protein ACR2OH_04060 [Microthrixaceae bacterium]
MQRGGRTTLLINGAVAHPMEMMQREGPLRSLLKLVGPDDAADHATVSSADGQYRASIPLEWLLKGRMQAGRLRIPAAPTKCWSVKDVVSIELTEGPRPDSVRPESFTTCVPDS